MGPEAPEGSAGTGPVADPEAWVSERKRDAGRTAGRDAQTGSDVAFLSAERHLVANRTSYCVIAFFLSLFVPHSHPPAPSSTTHFFPPYLFIFSPFLIFILYFLLFLSFPVFPLLISAPLPSLLLAHGTPLCALPRYYAICCQPLVYRNKMTPLRIALMLGGCWLIPMFISFLPIMQGWNNIGIIDLVSTHTDAAVYCPVNFVCLGS